MARPNFQPRNSYKKIIECVCVYEKERTSLHLIERAKEAFMGGGGSVKMAEKELTLTMCGATFATNNATHSSNMEERR